MGILLVALLALALIAGSSMAASISLKLSGPGAVNDSTIRVGDTVLVDIYWTNDKPRRGFTVGFEISSKDIKNVLHVSDSGKGLNKNGDVKGYNGWEDKSIFDVTGVMIPEVDWDGELPDVLGFGGAVAKQRYNAHEEMKCLSFEMIVPETGTLTVDSSFWPPGGYWKFGSGEKPEWTGPYHFKVVEAAKEAKKAEK